MKYNIRVIVSAVIALFVATFCFAPKSFALDLYNYDELLTKLRKNHLLQDKDIAEIKNSYPNLEILGSLQLQYSNARAESGTDRISDLYLRRVNLTIVGNVSEKASFVFQPEYGRGEPTIKDAYFAYKRPAFEIIAGNHAVPFSSDTLKNDLYLPFVERNLSSQISPDRLPGASVVAKMFNSKLLLQAGVWNGNLNSNAEADLINNKLSENQVFSANSGTSGSNILVEAVRIGFYSKGRDDFYSQEHEQDGEENFNGGKSIGLGVSYYTSAAVNSNLSINGLTGLNGVKAYEADLLFRIWRFTGEFEYAKRSLDWWQYNFAQTTSVAVASEQTASSAQLSVLLIGNLSLSVRQDAFAYDSKGKVLKGSDGQDQDKWMTTGLNYYFKEQHTKIQANYVRKNMTMPAGVSAPSSNAALVQVTTYF